MDSYLSQAQSEGIFTGDWTRVASSIAQDITDNTNLYQSHLQSSLTLTSQKTNFVDRIWVIGDAE